MLDSVKAQLRNTAVLKAYMMPKRLRFALHYYEKPLKNMAVWLFQSNETANFTYDLTPMNREHLAWFVSVITGCPLERIKGYIDEIEGDAQLRAHIRDAVLASDQRYTSDLEAHYGRRIGWYAFVRALKPRVVVETGVDQGLGSCVLAAALLRNEAEGKPGMAYGTDIRPEAGFLLRGPYARVAKTLYGDSIESLQKLDQPIDLFVNDSDHSAEYEYREYQTIADKLSPNGIILGDNAHVTPSLMRFAGETGRSFLFFQERPEAHWYPGAGIGVAFRKTAPST